MCILGMVAWLPVDQCQEETKQGSKIRVLRNNRSHAHYSHQCCGSTYLPPPLELVIQSDARSAAHQLWSLGCWSYLHPSRGHCSILLRLQQSDPTFNMGIDSMKPVYNFDPQYRVNVLTREDWAKATGAPPAVKRARPVYRRVQDEGWGRGWSLWAIGETKAQFLPRQIHNNFSGGDVCHLSLCLRDSISE